MKTKLVRNLSSVHSIRQVLFVGEHKEQSIPQLIFTQHPLQLLTCLSDSLPIVGVDHENDTLGVLEIMPPQRSNLILSSDIPDCERNVLVLDRLHIKTNGRDSGDNFTEFKLVKDGCFTSSIETDHKDSHFLLAEEAIKELGDGKTHEAEARLKELTGEAKHKVQEATKDAPFNFSEGVEGIVRAAESALHKTEHKAAEAADKVKPAEARPSSPFPDTQRPRELKPETVTPQVPSYEGKKLYTGPPLPLGHEPPPGYYLPPPPSTKKEKVEEKVEEIKERLPLLVPKVKEFASEEPIISQLASTIDSLTSSLSTPSKALSSDATGILNKAQDDLTALNARLQEVKKAEKAKLEQSISEKKKEFEALLKSMEAEKAKSEEGLKQTWQHERQTMVEDWRKELEGELEQQRQSIEQRLREEVVSQGIELQRRWLRSIKTQVETERGGRLAKLDSLTTSLKQLERITLDNSATLDDNVRLHKIWSALRAVQSKVDSGDLAFDDELRALKSLSTPTASSGEGVVRSALEQIEKSGIPQTGVKSFAALSSWFTNTVAPRIQSSSLVPAPEEATVISHLASAGLSKIMFRPQAGRVPGDSVGAVLARAEWCLAEKDLDGAAREINSLTGWPAKLANDWLQQARRKLEVQQALEVVATEATLSSLLLV